MLVLKARTRTWRQGVFVNLSLRPLRCTWKVMAEVEDMFAKKKAVKNPLVLVGERFSPISV